MTGIFRSAKFVAVTLVLAGAIAVPALVTGFEDRSAEVYDPSVIGEVWLDIPNASWMPIDDEALTACERHSRSYYPGTMKIGTAEFPGSGIRVKGGCGSSRLLDEKSAFKTNLSWDDPEIEGCPEIRLYKGVRKFTFNNQVEDASFTHERIGYDFLQKLGIPVPRAAPVRLYVNQQLWGLYLNLETIDRRFLARHFDSMHGMLYEADYGCDVGEESCFEMKFDTDACDDPLQGDPTDMTPLRALNARLQQIPADQFYPAINQVFDFDAYLTMWAAGVVMGYWDGYPSDPNNFRIYHDPTDDRWSFIPTGIDQLFEEDVDPFNPTGMLSIRCLAEQACETAFRAKLAQVIDLFEASDYPAMARAIEKQVRDDVMADPRKEMTISEWHQAVNDTVRYMQRRPAELRALLRQTRQDSPRQDFYFHALTDPNGKRFVLVSWQITGEAEGPGQKWVTAKGYFEGLTAKMDAIELEGSSSSGRKIGTVIVDFVNCQTAAFHFTPSDSGGQELVRTAQVDSGIWKYCEQGTAP
jgi:hypothetical protein